MIDKILSSKSNILYDDDIGWVPMSKLVDQARRTHAGKKVVISLSPSPFDGFMDWLGAITNNIPLHQWMRTGEYDPGEVKPGFMHTAYTSGTTGYPQRIENSLEMFYLPAEDTNRIIWKDDGAMYATIPASTNNATSLNWLPALISDRNLILKKFNQYSWKQDVEKYNVSFFLGPMAFSRILINNKEVRNTRKWKTLKAVGAGANILDPGTLEWWAERGVVGWNVYGSTEMPGFAISGNTENWLNVFMPSTKVRVNDNNVLEFQRGNSDWWVSNDIVQANEKKGWTIIGRTTTQFKFRDIRICPEQYEALAKSATGVSNAGLTLINNRLVLFYEGLDGIENKILEQIEPYVQLGTLPKVKQVAKIPINHLGKLERKELLNL